MNFKVTGRLLPRSNPAALPIRFARDLGKVAVGFAETGALRSTQAAERLAICRACAEYFEPMLERCRHPKCGCFMRAKTWFHALHCPAGKW